MKPILNNFVSRSITGVLFVAFIVGSIILNKYIFSSLFLIITILGLLEFYKLAEKDNIKPQKLTGILIACVFYISNLLLSENFIENKIFLINIPLLFLIFVAELYRKEKNSFTNIAYTLLGIIYIALPFSLLNYFFNPKFITGETHINIILGFFLLVWTNDTAAYILGSKFGKHKLFEKISPKKTWEGFIGGAVFSFILAYAISLYFGEFCLIQWLIIDFIIIVAGIFGDLTESLFKRNLNCKDSGKILPGHGGILDRFDSVLLASPFVFTYIMIIS
jgi:phosphatidate cytidylyltransferase